LSAPAWPSTEKSPPVGRTAHVGPARYWFEDGQGDVGNGRDRAMAAGALPMRDARKKDM